ncbi:hypothetical protein BKA69DRAFT_1042214 [Paraphysoderma sedebokerense]|nr:hypothetical protein BKA69DRAFT_1042214 [Paraphysoderma sedebokerense]
MTIKNWDSSNGQNQPPPNLRDAIEKFARESYSIEIKSLVSNRQKVQFAAKKLSDDIAADEGAVEKLKKRDVAITEISTCLHEKLYTDDELLPKLLITLNTPCLGIQENFLVM